MRQSTHRTGSSGPKRLPKGATPVPALVAHVLGGHSDADSCPVALWNTDQVASFDHAVIEHSPNAVIAVDSHGKLVVFNPTARSWYSLDARTVPEAEWGDYFRLYAADGMTPISATEMPLARATAGETVRNFEMVLVTLGQKPRYLSCSGGPFFGPDGERVGSFVVQVDTTEVHVLTLELERLASHDALTGLRNRRSFEAEVERAGSFAARGTASMILFADVDRFKTCNDRFGHEFGDQVLQEIATALSQTVREVDTVARIGGDEFGIVLWNVDHPAALLVARRLSASVAEVGARHGLDIGLSIGAAPIDGEHDAATALAYADTRMYEMKAASARE